jgi:hypothetical protein
MNAARIFEGLQLRIGSAKKPAAMTATVIACAMVLNDTRRMTVDNADVASTERRDGV